MFVQGQGVGNASQAIITFTTPVRSVPWFHPKSPHKYAEWILGDGWSMASSLCYLFVCCIPSQYPVSCVDGATSYYNHTRRHTKAPTCIPTLLSTETKATENNRLVSACVVWMHFGNELHLPSTGEIELNGDDNRMVCGRDDKEKPKQSSNLDELGCRTSKIQFSQGATNPVVHTIPSSFDVCKWKYVRCWFTADYLCTAPNWFNFAICKRLHSILGAGGIGYNGPSAAPVAVAGKSFPMPIMQYIVLRFRVCILAWT